MIILPKCRFFSWLLQRSCNELYCRYLMPWDPSLRSNLLRKSLAMLESFEASSKIIIIRQLWMDARNGVPRNLRWRHWRWKPPIHLNLVIKVRFIESYIRMHNRMGIVAVPSMHHRVIEAREEVIASLKIGPFKAVWDIELCNGVTWGDVIAVPSLKSFGLQRAVIDGLVTQASAC